MRLSMSFRDAFIALLIVLAVPASAGAKEWKNYDAASFAQAQKAGKTIYVAVHAAWCVYCQAQAPILDQLTNETPFRDIVTFRVDYDTERAFNQAHKVRMQSTLIVFKGEREIARSVADTKRDSIRALLEKGL